MMTKENFELRTEFIDLLQLLKATGYAATGGEAKMMVDDGLVAVNGEGESRKRRKLRIGDEVNVDNQILIALIASE
jgi:ribosome-associated protein